MNALNFPDIEWGDADGLVTAIRAHNEPIDSDILQSIRAPFDELNATVMTSRASYLGAAVGRNFYHHEGRGRPATPDEHRPEISVSEHGCDPVWDFGVLVAPKYFSFFQDSIFAAFHPNHRTKWRAHEMLHGAARFFWRPTMSRFEAYLAARLNELLPVAHWYYFDEIDRVRCAEHLRQIPTHYCTQCDRVAAYWEKQIRRDDAHSLASDGYAHLDSEFAAVESAIELGRDVEVQYRHGLNPSTDGVAYMRAHWNRITSFSVGAFVERFLVDGQDYFSNLEAYVRHVRRMSQSFLSGDISQPEEEIERQQARSELLDLLQRAMFVAEFDEAFEDAAEALFQESEALLTKPKRQNRDEVDLIRQALIALNPTLRTDGIYSHNHNHVMAGLQTVSDEPVHEIQTFVSSNEFWKRGTVAERYSAFSSDPAWNMPAAVSMLPRIDLEGERFGGFTDSVPELARGRVRVNETLRTIDQKTLGYHFDGSFRLVDNTPQLSELIDAIDSDDIVFESIDISTLLESVESGLVFWFPEVAR